MRASQAVRRQVLRGIALNRTPGLHFAGNFLDVSFDHVTRDGVRLSVDPGPWCAEADGQVDLGALAILADLALAACIRAHLASATRLATVTMNLQFTGVPRAGRLRAEGRFEGFLREGAGHLGMSRVSVRGRSGQICYGTGTFMALEPPQGVTLHPVPLRTRRAPEPALPAERELHAAERAILRRADAVLADATLADGEDSFIRRFWGGQFHRAPAGAAGVLENGPHIGNRVGHAQGGILLALAAGTAAAALTPHWRLSGIAVSYIRPGEGRKLRARARVVHHGRLTAVVRTEIFGRGRRRVLEVTSTHAAISA